MNEWQEQLDEIEKERKRENRGEDEKRKREKRRRMKEKMNCSIIMPSPPHLKTITSTEL